MQSHAVQTIHLRTMLQDETHEQTRITQIQEVQEVVIHRQVDRIVTLEQVVQVIVQVRVVRVAARQVVRVAVHQAVLHQDDDANKTPIILI